MASSIVLQQPSHCFFPCHQLLKPCGHGGFITCEMQNRKRIRPIRASLAIETPPTASFPFFNPPPQPEDSLVSELEPVDPDFYKIGYVRTVRAYGIEFKEGPDGFGVYASKDIEPTRRAKTDWDLRLACLLLFAFDVEGNFWQLYGDFLPSADECTSLLLATEEDLLELQDQDLASTMREQQYRALQFWEKNWVWALYLSSFCLEQSLLLLQVLLFYPVAQNFSTLPLGQHSGVPLKIKRLAREPERFIWAVSMAQSRCIDMQTRIGALVQDANMLIPYAGEFLQPNVCCLNV
ncbi:plastid transcriptionally active 14 [Actinidia rufa]|uniref:Plastid transcriptionally active 14 n=1 Tax=Actinidia rufa TaxID=165716 RepID=A0A7J0DXZ7_9ERIC|nr:plastid transcriptionally active 14 [Actinidia rufa]